jgi:hypothetical protein
VYDLDELTLIFNLLSKQKMVDACEYEGWKVKCYFGPSQTKSNTLEYSACAITDDVTQALEPVLPKNNCIQLILDNRSVIWWSASTRSVLTRKVKKTFAKFNWSAIC